MKKLSYTVRKFTKESSGFNAIALENIFLMKINCVFKILFKILYLLPRIELPAGA